MWLEINMDNIPGTNLLINNANPCYSLGNALINMVEVKLGGQTVDRQYGEWLTIWSELTTTSGKIEGYDKLVGNTLNNSSTNSVLMVPLSFWFNTNYGLALPLICLPDKYVEIVFNFEKPEVLFSGTVYPNIQIKLIGKFIYLEEDEHKRFLNNEHYYMFEYLHYHGNFNIINGVNTNIPLTIVSPAKELIWVSQDNIVTGRTSSAKQPCLFTPLHFSDINTNNMSSAYIQFNDKESTQNYNMNHYITRIPYLHHTHIPRDGPVLKDNNNNLMSNGQNIYLYSFALHPEDYQPSGTCNIKNMSLVINNPVLPYSTEGFIKVYSRNYGYLIIKNNSHFVLY
jgi:hypothetical protein